MHRDLCLSSLEPGGHATIADILTEGGMRRRLEDIGICRGTRVTCLQKSPLGDPAAFLIRGAVFALRTADSSYIRIIQTDS